MATIKATAKALLTGQQTASGTYILPHVGGYVFGRWYRSRHGGFGEHTRWVQLGERPAVAACRDAMEQIEKAQELRARTLNRRRRRNV